jgi:hypothetical protein
VTEIGNHSDEIAWIQFAMMNPTESDLFLFLV